MRRAFVAVALVLAAGTSGAACGDSEGGGGDVTSPCGVVEPGNDTFENASIYELGSEQTGCIGPTAGADYYQLLAPADAPGGGYLQITVDGPGRVVTTLYGDTAGATLGQAAADGQSGAVTFFAAMAPGMTYRLGVADDGAAPAPYTYRITAAFTPVADPFEPNDSMAEATPMAAGAPVQAFLFAGYGPTVDPTVYDDYFRVSLGGGQTVTVEIQDVPATLAPRLFLYDGQGMELGRVTSGHRGEPLTMRPPLALTGGEYVVRVGVWGESPSPMSAGAAPDNFTRPYRLIVTQP